MLMFREFLKKTSGVFFLLIFLGGFSSLVAAEQVSGSFAPSSGATFYSGGRLVVTIEVTPANLGTAIYGIDAYVYYNGTQLGSPEITDLLSGATWAAPTKKIFHYNDSWSYVQYSRGAASTTTPGMTISSKTSIYQLSFPIKSTFTGDTTLYLGDDPLTDFDGFHVYDANKNDLTEINPSATYTVNANQPPTAPILVLPTSDETGVSLKPLFSWEASTDPDGGSVTYTLIVDDDDNVDSSPLTSEAGLTSTTKESSITLVAGITHYWKVRATDDEGASTDSLVWRFTTLGNPTITSIDWYDPEGDGDDDDHFVADSGGTYLIIEGSNFGNPGSNPADSDTFNVKIDGKKITDYRSGGGNGIYYWAPEGIKIDVGVPLIAEGTYLVAGSKSIKVTANGLSDEDFEDLHPYIKAVAPSSGKPGAVATIEGTAFGTGISGSNKSTIEVIVGGKTAEVISATNTSLTVMVPSDISSGTKTLYVKVNRKDSNNLSFEVLGTFYLDLTVLMHGYYDSAFDTQKAATVEVEFRQGDDPQSAQPVLTSEALTLGTSVGNRGKVEATITGLEDGGRYYLVVRQVGVSSKKKVNHLSVITQDRQTFYEDQTKGVNLSDKNSGDYKPAWNPYPDYRPDPMYTMTVGTKTYKLMRGGDATGDGQIDREDYLLYLEALELFADDGTNTPEADFNENGVIDDGDYSIWENNEGTGTYVPGELKE